MPYGHWLGGVKANWRRNAARLPGTVTMLPFDVRKSLFQCKWMFGSVVKVHRLDDKAYTPTPSETGDVEWHASPIGGGDYKVDNYTTVKYILCG